MIKILTNSEFGFRSEYEMEDESADKYPTYGDKIRRVFTISIPAILCSYLGMG